MSSPINLYEHLADELGALIASRVFAPGDRLPSIRHLAQQKRLSISTWTEALVLAVALGIRGAGCAAVGCAPAGGCCASTRPASKAVPASAAKMRVIDIRSPACAFP